MIATCKLEACPYHEKHGFCSNPTLGIDENGMCSMIWRHGQQITFFNNFNDKSLFPKGETINVIDDISVKEVKKEKPVKKNS